MTQLVWLTGWLVAALVTALTARGRARERELVARAAHELRGPLTAARLAVHALARARASADPRATLAGLDSELQRAGRALDDLAAAREGRFARHRPEDFDLAGLVGDTVAAWRPLAEAHRVELRLAWPLGSVHLHGDRARLAQACANLIANAVEASALAGAGGRVEVRGRATPHGVRVEVEDDGPGLGAPLAALTATARGGRGRRGRGLAIARAAAEDHGGRIVSAPSAGGARMALELPGAVARPLERPA